MPIIERDVVLQSMDDAGQQTVDFPITRLANVEDSADVKQSPDKEDYIPLIDSADSGQMKKVPFSGVMEQVNAAIQAAVLASWEGAY